MAARGQTLHLNRTAGLPGAPANGSGFFAELSGNGRFVAFESGADNLSNEDDNDHTNIFVRDTFTGATQLVSRANGQNGAAADASSGQARISQDGRFVAFVSSADNLSGFDDDNLSDVFLRDIQAGTTAFVSRTDLEPANDNSSSPSVSADGRFVAFSSGADNLSAEDNNSFRNIFVRDTLGDGETTLVSHNGVVGANDDSFEPKISADGSSVAFSSSGDNLSNADNDTVQNIYVGDSQGAGVAEVASLTSASVGVTDHSGNPAISADGRFVAFESRADNLSSADDDDFVNVFVRDTGANVTTLASRAAAGADGSSDLPAISADGRFVAFESEAENLSTADTDNTFDIFVRDTQLGTTTFASRANGIGGAGANGGSFEPSISGDGRFVAFGSDANNLSAVDNDGVSNLFRRDVRGGPPRCSDLVQAVSRGAPTTLTLPCLDDDGDPITRALLGGPAHGTLGAIDQATGRVTYTPGAGYAGPDSLSFRASDATGSSDTATGASR